MAVASGIAAQIGVVAEVTPGTYVAPTRFFPFLDEDVKLNINRIPKMGLMAGRQVMRGRGEGTREVTGGWNMETPAASIGLLLKHAMGGVSTTGSGPYTHAFTLGDIDALALTVQVGRPDSGGTVRPFSYTGCSITGVSFAAAVNDWLKTRWDVYGMSGVTSEALASASYATGVTDPFLFSHGSLTIEGAANDIKSFDMRLDNGLATGRHFIRATTPTQPKIAKRAGMRGISGTITTDFDSLTNYGLFVAGTVSTLELVFDSGDDELTITAEVQFDGDTPTVSGPTMLEQSLPFTVMHATSDASAFTVELVNGDSAP